MSIWKDLDPTGNNFLGLGPHIGRILAALGTANASEMHRTDPFGTTPGSAANHFGRSLGGIGPGAVGGFVTGGVPGAIVGGVGGGAAAGTGATNSTTLSGWGENLGIGAGAGGLAGYGAGLASGGSSGGFAGSLAAPSASGGVGASGSGATASSPVSRALQMMRGMPSNNQEQGATAAPQMSPMERVYAMYPQLRPHLGGFNG